MSNLISIGAGLVSILLLLILRNFALKSYSKKLTFSVYFHHKNFSKVTLFIISGWVYLLIFSLVFPYLNYLQIYTKILFLIVSFLSLTLVFQSMDRPFSILHQLYYYVFFPTLLIPVCNFVLISKHVILLILVLISFAILAYLPIIVKTKITAHHQSVYLFFVILIYIVGLNYM